MDGSGRKKPSYEELEHRFLTLQEQNEALKKQTSQQEERIKVLATRLVKVMNDVKKQQPETASDLTASSGTPRSPLSLNGRKRDPELEDAIEDLRNRLAESTKKNNQLTQKVKSLSMQLARSQKIHRDPYAHVPSRIRASSSDSASSSPRKRPNSASGRLVASSPRSVERDTPRAADTAEQLEDLSSEDPQTLQEMVYILSQRLAETEQQLALLREQSTGDTPSAESESTSAHAPEKTKTAEASVSTTPSFSQISSNSLTTTLAATALSTPGDINALRRELAEKGSQVAMLKAEYERSTSTLEALRSDYAKVLEMNEKLNKELLEERQRVLALEHDVGRVRTAGETVEECHAVIAELRRDNKDLKDEVARLRKGVLELDKEKEARYKEKLDQLREKIDTVVKEKIQIEDQIDELKKIDQRRAEECKALVEKAEKMRVKYEEAKQERATLQAQLIEHKTRTEELTQKLELLSTNHGLQLATPITTKEKEELLELREHNTELAREVQRLSELLKIQDGLANDSKKMISAHQEQYSMLKRELEEQLRMKDRMLEMRNEKIRQLEAQQSALLAKLYNTARRGDKGGSEADANTAQAKDNAVEVGIASLTIRPAHITVATLAALGLSNVDTFIALPKFISFNFMHLRQRTPPTLAGASDAAANGGPAVRVDMNFVANFVVTEDEYFFYIVQSQPITFELYVLLPAQAAAHTDGVDMHAGEPHLVATCRVSLRELLEGSSGRPAGSKMLFTSDMLTAADGAPLAVLQYSLRFLHPISMATVPHPPTLPSEGPLTQGSRRIAAGTAAWHDEIVIEIVQCKNLQSPMGSGVLPSAYLEYSFYGKLHDTHIIPNTADPVFNDVAAFPVDVDSALEEYLTRNSLEIDVLDDNDRSNNDQLLFLLGSVSVPLHPLLRFGPSLSNVTPTKTASTRPIAIEGEYPIVSLKTGRECGVVQLRIYWKSLAKTSTDEKTPKSLTGSTVAKLRQLEKSISISPTTSGTSKFTETRVPSPPPLQSSQRGGGPKKQRGNKKHAEAAKSSAATRSSPTTVLPTESASVNTVSPNPPLGVPEPTPSVVSPKLPPEESPRVVVAKKASAARPTSAAPTNSISRAPRKDSMSAPNTPKSTRTNAVEAASPRVVSGSPRDHKQSAVDPATGPVPPIVIALEKLALDTLFLEQRSTCRRVFVSFEFLDYPENELETKAFAVDPHTPCVVLDYRKEFAVDTPRSKYKVFALVNSPRRSDSDVHFDVFEEHENRECYLVATAEVNLMSLVELGHDLIKQDLVVRDEVENPVGKLVVSVTCVESLKRMIALSAAEEERERKRKI